MSQPPPQPAPIVKPWPTNVRWLVLAAVAFASASAYLTRYCISAANTTMQRELQFDNDQMGQLMSAFALGYLLFQVPGGWLGNRLGTRLAFCGISLCWSLCNVWTGAAWTLAALWASRFSLGMFQAGLVPITAKILGDWMPVSKRGVSSACIAASMSVGGAFTLWLTGWLLARGVPWRSVFYAYSLVGVVWAAAFYWLFRTYPSEHPRVNDAELTLIRQPAADRQVAAGQPSLKRPGGPPAEPHREPLGGAALAWRMLGSPGMWGICLQSFFRAAGYIFFVTWFFAFLEYAYQINKSEAGLLNSLPLIAVVIGSLLGGAVVDKLLRWTGSRWVSRSGVAMVALAACGQLTMAAGWMSSAAQLSVVIAVAAAFSGIGNPAAWSATIDIGGRHTAVVMGVMNMAGCLAGVILPAVLGKWFDHILESGGNWNAVINLHAAFYFCGALSWLLVNPNRTLDE